MTPASTLAVAPEIYEQCGARQYNTWTEDKSRFIQVAESHNMVDMQIKPQQNLQKRYKARFKHLSPEDKQKLKSARCLVTISVGQEIHEGEKLKAAIKVINKSFKEAVLVMDDTLQRHTHAILDPHKTAEELYEFSHLEGDLWWQRNKGIIYEELTILRKVLRWEHWLKHRTFSKCYDKISSLYRDDKLYQTEVDANIVDFLSRFRSEKKYDYAHAFQSCLNYLKEECAAMCLWTEELCEFEVYPRPRNKSMSATYAKLIKPLAPDLLKSLSLRFASLDEVLT